LEQFSKGQFFQNKKAALIGGTAMAFHVKHRMSFDIQAKKADEFDIEAEGIMEPKMDLVGYKVLKSYLVEKLINVE
jgi:hypothetical protein